MGLSVNLPLRLGRDCYTAGAIVSDYYFSLRGIEEVERRKEVMQECHIRGANRLVDLCFANGGIYIKLGQHVGQLDHLLPQAYVLTMRENLLDKCPLTSFQDICKTFKDDLGQHPNEAFATFDPSPVASASLAQVHVAWGHDGKKYAVKVQHPGLQDTSAADILTIEGLVRGVKLLFPSFDYTWLVEEVKENLPKELDFVNEARNAERTMRNLASSKSRVRGRVKVPAIDGSLSSSRILTMEFIDGVRVTDREGLQEIGVDPKEVADLLSTTFSEMVFVFGEVHCDPHEANLLVRNENGRAELVLLDHGLYQMIDNDFRHDYAALWHALIFADEESIKTYSHRMNAGDMYPFFAAMLTTKPWDEITQQTTDHLKLSGSMEERDRIQAYAKEYAGEISELLLRIPRALLLLLKTNDCLRAIDRSLGQPINTFKVTARECTRALAEKRSNRLPPLVSHAVYYYDVINVEFRLVMLRLFTTWASVRGWLAQGML
ncbi:hypothetical protein BSKO_09420 [Bryopsis sp. KO-2023]|nr:hypothetical protein BSKO_09420 [Bryopsis sp. KO-2023]